MSDENRWHWDASVDRSVRLGISAMTFTNWRRGSRPGLEKIQLLCRVFDVTLSEFFAKGEEIVAEEEAKRQRRIQDNARTLLERYPTKEELLEAIEGFDEATRRTIRRQLLQLKAVKTHLAFLEELKERGIDVESLTYGDLIHHYLGKNPLED